MTEHTFGDPLPDEVGDELDDDYDDQPESLSEGFDAPQVGAVTAFVLAVLSFAGFGLMNGSAYVGPLVVGQTHGRMVFSLVLGAALALVPVGLGWHAASRALDDDARWINTLARTAMLLGLASMLLRLVVAVIQASQDTSTVFVRF